MSPGMGLERSLTRAPAGYTRFRTLLPDRCQDAASLRMEPFRPSREMHLVLTWGAAAAFSSMAFAPTAAWAAGFWAQGATAWLWMTSASPRSAGQMMAKSITSWPSQLRRTPSSCETPPWEDFRPMTMSTELISERILREALLWRTVYSTS